MLTHTVWSGVTTTVGKVGGSGSSDFSTLVDSVDMYSSSHKRQSGGVYRTGGPWFLNKTTQTASPVQAIRKNGSGVPIWVGTVMTPHWGGGAIPTSKSDNDMDAAGATAMSRVLPTNPNVNLITSVTEMVRDGIPDALGVNTWKQRTNAARAAGGEYLNVEFGWKPLVSDITKFVDSSREVDRLIGQFISQSDKPIFRRYDYPTEISVGVATGTGYGSPTSSAIQWTGTSTTTTTIKEWSEFCFRYHIPRGADFESRMAKTRSVANKLIGLRLTPDVVWSVAPWSWAVDWFTNTGDILKNNSALGNDGLTLLYGYHMREYTVKTVTVSTSLPFNGNGPLTSTRTIERTVKQRRPANPYGFGAGGLPLTTRKQAIIAAIATSSTSQGRRSM